MPLFSDEFRQWLATNGLAFYGAVVGSLALGLNVVRFFYDRRKDGLLLRVLSKPDPQLEENSARLLAPPGRLGEGPFLLPGYVVTVYNDGHIPASVEDVGVTTHEGTDVAALVDRASVSSWHLVPVSQGENDPIPPKSSRKFTVYLRRESPKPLAVKGCYAIDRTGKRWKGKHVRA